MKRLSSTDLLAFRNKNYEISDKIKSTVEQIVNEVKNFSDQSLLNYAKWLENNDKQKIIIEDEELNRIAEKIDVKSKEAIDIAWKNIYKFHKKQIPANYELETSDGITCSLKYRGLNRVGIYIPGGTAPLFSTLLMLGIPASVAGVNEIIICTPYNKNESLIPEIAYIAKRLNINKIFRVGGAQSIAAMAFGTETVPKVDKIFGPGNQYVTYAKQYVSLISKTGIDMPAGPSEVLVVADNNSNPEFIAQDILAQAEHGTDSITVLLSSSVAIIDRVGLILKSELKDHPRSAILKESIKNYYSVVVDKIEEAISLSNQFGPEHLILSIDEPEKYQDQVDNAGSVFLGKYSAESFGDYASGTNHTLPTSGYSNAYSSVRTSDFMKSISFQAINETGLKDLGPYVVTMANREGLYSHAKSVEVRLRGEK